jgi:monoamine oxidase
MASTDNDYDTIVIGAGAAGLAAAATLLSQGQAVCILEARERIGGRIFTVTDATVPVPVELGAEFIHGRSPAIFRQLDRSGQFAVDASHTRFTVRDGRLQSGDSIFERMMESLGAIARPSRDLPFAEFLERHRRTLSKPVRTLARTLVEGFDAADATRVSTLEILKEWSGSSAAGAPAFRPSLGYGALLQNLVGTFDPGLTSLRLGAAVHEVRWKRGHAVVSATHHGQLMRVNGAQVVIAVPLGVLQLPPRASGAIRFDPELREKRPALSGLAVGPVIKIVAHFCRAFWAEIDAGRYHDGAFFHCPDAPFPTCWTTLPSRTRVLNLWAAGPNAARLAGQRRAAVLQLALESLASMFGARLDYRSLLEAVHWHDWQQDNYACGAYSYPLVNGARARKLLARPMDGTLFFAGEATDSTEAGSVGGALASGERAALEILRLGVERRTRKRKRSSGTGRA